MMPGDEKCNALKADLLAYHTDHRCWGPLRPAFDDGDLHNNGLIQCRSHARAREDGAALGLINRLLKVAEGRRRQLRREVMEATFPAKAPDGVEVPAVEVAEEGGDEEPSTDA